MAYPTLLLHLELGQPSKGLLQVACEMANKFDAHVVGIAGCQPFSLTFGEGYLYSDFFETSNTQLNAQVKELEATFRQSLKPNVRSLEWRSTTQCVSIASYVAQAARAADLIMIAGRPLLVVPETLTSPAVSNVMIAWKDTCEARRAVLDALPLLKPAAYVTIVELATEAKLASARDRLDDVSRWLNRHDIDAKPNAVVSYGDDVRQLEAIAEDQRAELIVAGAYGHSRICEWVFSGITEELLIPTARCSFLSH